MPDLRLACEIAVEELEQAIALYQQGEHPVGHAIRPGSGSRTSNTPSLSGCRGWLPKPVTGTAGGGSTPFPRLLNNGSPGMFGAPRG